MNLQNLEGTSETGAPRLEGTFRRVVVATDLTPFAEPALARALRLPLSRDAELTLVHLAAPRGGTSDQRHEQSQLHRQCLTRLANRAKRARPWVDVRWEETVTDTPLAELSKRARRADAELVVMSHPQGPGSLVERIRERVAGSVLDRLTRSVLIVAPRLARPYARPVVAVDLSPASQEPVAWALRVAPEASCVRVLHDYDAPYELVLRTTGASAQRVLAYRRRVEEEARRSLDELLEPFERPGLRIEKVLHHGEPAHDLLTDAAALEADLLVVGRHRRGPMGRLVRPHVSDQVLAKAVSDVLIVAGEE